MLFLLSAVAATAVSPSLSDIEMAFTPFPPIEAATAAGRPPAPPPPPIKNNFVSRTLGDNMVLQRAPAQAVLWGFAGIGNTVSVTMDKAPHIDAVTDAQGFWRCTLPAQQPGAKGHTFVIKSSNGTTATVLSSPKPPDPPLFLSSLPFSLSLSLSLSIYF